ncbi:MAG: rhomboid family intramembrane serine protease [Flavobacteriales bacterium]|jgi:membrane associated rhomboid family serine protease|nr:rhomboid family intramembrane serine protease [Flavobacteriales bacterium]MBT6746129.1 rhomboid family intramembrane serine protease [Flavobacteriales bacterium]
MRGFGDIPLVVKNLLIINAIFFAIKLGFGKPIDTLLALHYWDSPFFQPHQIITHMFMHGGVFHLVFNMFGLWMFGSAVEKIWGPKRFLQFFVFSGLGAALFHFIIIYFRINNLESQLEPEQIQLVISEGADALAGNQNFINEQMGRLNLLYNIGIVGASGALFGVLLAFAMMFPDTELFIMFIPIPIKAKYAVLGFGAYELFSGTARIEGDNIAHFAHLGGLLFGFLMITYWKKTGKGLY